LLTTRQPTPGSLAKKTARFYLATYSSKPLRRIKKRNLVKKKDLL